jgi:hypothetical protein
LLADSESILKRWKNHLPVNVYRVNYVRHTETHMAEPLVPKPSASEVEMAYENLKRYTSSGTE